MGYMKDSTGKRLDSFPVQSVSGQRLVALGDSITIAGDDLGTSGPIRRDSFPFFTSLLSGGRVYFIRNAGKGGNKTADMLARFDADVTPYNPTMVTILAGTNDFTFGVTDQQYKDNIKALVAKCRAIGALPVLFTPPPVNSFATPEKQKVVRIRAWLGQYGASQRIPVVDAYGVVVDPTTVGNWKAAYDNGDGIHPNGAGAFAIGAEAARVLSDILAPMAGLVTASNVDPNNVFSNCMFLTDTNADGLPDSWAVRTAATGGTGASTIQTDALVPGGKALRLSLTGATGKYELTQTKTTGVTAGDKIRVSCIVTTTGVAGAQLNVAFPNSFINNQNYFANGPVTRMPWVFEITVPAGGETIELRPAVLAAATSTTAYAEFAAVTVYNMTTGNLVNL